MILAGYRLADLLNAGNVKTLIERRDSKNSQAWLDGEISSILAFVFPALSTYFVRPRQHVLAESSGDLLSCFQID
jgi:hypothetical protein